MSKSIHITNRKGEIFEFIVDDDRYEEVAKYRWHVSGAKNCRYIGRSAGPKIYYLHWQIIGKPSPGMVVDHINGNRFDNRLSNLRICSRAGNSRNAKLRHDNSCKLKGATYSKDAGYWQGQIKVNGKRIHLGSFNTPEEAHRAYCEAGRKHHGEFFNPG